MFHGKKLRIQNANHHIANLHVYAILCIVVYYNFYYKIEFSSLSALLQYRKLLYVIVETLSGWQFTIL